MCFEVYWFDVWFFLNFEFLVVYVIVEGCEMFWFGCFEECGEGDFDFCVDELY